MPSAVNCEEEVGVSVEKKAAKLRIKPAGVPQKKAASYGCTLKRGLGLFCAKLNEAGK